MILLPFPEFDLKYKECNGTKPTWYIRFFLRGFYCPKLDEIYINQDGLYLNKQDYELVKAHEKGHQEGKEHTLFGVMSPYGLIRYLTAW